MELFQGGRIVIAVTPVDWRWGIRRLTACCEFDLGIEKFTDGDSAWVVFINKWRTAVRVLHYGDTRIELYEVRLRFGSKFPELIEKLQAGKTVPLSREVLQTWLSGQVGPFKLCG